MKQILALTAAVLMFVTLCGGCGKSGKGWSTDGTKLLNPELEPDPVDFGGQEFLVVDFNSGRWQRQESSNPYNDAWQRVLDNVEQKFNCTINFHGVSPGGALEEAQPEVMAGERYCDILCATQWHFGQLLGADLMLDLNQLNTNWEAIWWNQNIRRIATLRGNTFAANGSFIFDAAQTWLINFNRDMWDELDLPDPYEIVENGEWTIDLLLQYSKKALLDRDGNGNVDTIDDRWGITAADGDFARSLYMAAGNHYFIERDGRLEMDCQGSKTFDFVAKMRKLVKEDKSMADDYVKFENEAARAQWFINNGSLFYAYMPGSSALRDMEADWGVLPMPKADKEQESYMSGVDHNATVFGVTKTLAGDQAQMEKVGILLDALGYYALELERIYWPDYVETYWRDERDGDIVAKHVAKTGQYDMALIMSNVNPVFGTPVGMVFGTMFGSTTDFSSAVEMRKEQVNVALDKFFADLDREGGFGS
ncbi:MAG: extracellular solute-binding protein [Oscillospiraceae bacterium]|nr:extracellular solute-binding protein [Oscillospiraceae bacterium]